MAASSSLNTLLPALLIFLFISMIAQVKGRPSSRRPDAQVLQDLFGAEIGSLVLAPVEITEGSAEAPPPSQSHDGHRPQSPRVLLDILRQHRKLQGRSRKGVARGCFGMKVDRIGVISGLGC
uniref:C-type natriuretic peptide 2 n=1 Tax=Danio rerio TaxID=7955 RepID=E9QBW3_DANRE|nr:C-type natriuretic peptide 2-like [Danio rerio]|eukprot:XP_001919526.1 C-type natriuretic peptide 2-like [Danio rerio]